MKPKVLFRVDANKKIGWGHFYRCVALADMLKNSFDISFAISDPINDLINVLESKSINIIALPSQVYTTPDRRGDKELNFDLEELLGDVNVVVLDGYWFGPSYQQQLRKHPVKVAIIEDEGRGRYMADLIINHAPGIPKDKYQTDNENPLFALGTEYALLRAAFLKTARVQFKKESYIKKVLISFGGLDYYDNTSKTLDWLLNNTNVKVHVIIGAGYSHQEKLKKVMSNAQTRVILSQNLNEEQMASAMKTAGAAVLPASGVLFESIACRLPAISGAYTQNQEAIFNGFLSEGLIIDGGDFTNLTEAWSRLKNTDFADLKQKQVTMIDGKSPERFNKLFKCLL